MKCLNLSGTSSSCLFRLKNFDHTKGPEFLMVQTPNELRGHNPLWYPETECFMHFTTLHLFHLQRIIPQPATDSRPIWKADLLSELPQFFRTSPFQKSGDCHSKSDPKEESWPERSPALIWALVRNAKSHPRPRLQVCWVCWFIWEFNILL